MHCFLPIFGVMKYKFSTIISILFLILTFQQFIAMDEGFQNAPFLLHVVQDNWQAIIPLENHWLHSVRHLLKFVNLLVK